MAKLDPLVLQLRETCQATGAFWAAVIERADAGWSLRATSGLSRIQANSLKAYLRSAENMAWLSGAVAGGRVRSRNLNEFSEPLVCKRIHLFPVSEAGGAVVVGANALTGTETSFWRVLTLGVAARSEDVHGGHAAGPISPDTTPARLAGLMDRIFRLTELMQRSQPSFTLQGAALQLVHALKEAFSVPLVGILLPSPDRRWLYLYGNLEGDLPPFPVAGSLVGQVFETGLPVRSGDVRKAARYYEGVAGVRSEMAVPLKAGGDVIGVLNLESFKDDAFSQGDEYLLMLFATSVANLVDNLRLREQAAARLRNLELIYRVTESITGLKQAGQIAQQTAELLAEHFPAALIEVGLLEEGDRSIVLQGLAGRIPETLRRGYAFSTQRPSIRALLSGGGKTAPVSPESNLDGQQILALIHEEGQSFGFLCVTLPEGLSFAPVDELLIKSLAGLLAAVLLNALQYNALQQTVRQLMAVNDTATDISSSLNSSAVMQRIVKRARELVHAPGADLALVDPQRQRMTIVVSDSPWADYVGFSYPISSGLTGEVVTSGKSMSLRDYQTWAGRLDLPVAIAFHAILSVPLTFQDEVLGVLSVLDDDPDRIFNEDDRQFLEQLAPQLAVSLRNARLFEDLQQRMLAQRSAEDRLVRAARLAAIGELSAGVVHELTNPLTVISGFLELVDTELVPEQEGMRTELYYARQEALRARTVVKRLLDFSRPSDRVRIKSDINLLVQDVLALLGHLSWLGNIQLTTILDPDLPWVAMDSSQMKQVVLNICQNAVQALPDGGILTVSTERAQRKEKPYVIISIADSGQGMPPEVLAHVFEPFFTTRRDSDGTGLGLSVAYQIVLEHDGNIEVESSAGQGSCFRVLLPLEGTEN